MKSHLFRAASVGAVLCITNLVLCGCSEFRETLAPTRRVTPEVSLERMRTSLEFLASDEQEGRGVGTKGIERSAEFLAHRLQEIGLKPVEGAQDGYYQSFNMRGDATITPDTYLQIGEATLTAQKDYRPMSFSGNKSFAAPVTFVGYAAQSPEHAYDDFEGLDVTGRVVLAMRFEPHDNNGKSRFTGDDQWSQQESIVTKAENAAKAGAAALLLVNPPLYHQEEDRLARFSRRYSAKPVEIPVYQITRTMANDLLAKGGVRDLKSLQELIDTEGKPASAQLADDTAAVRGNVTIRRDEIAVRNVVAALPGRGRKSDEWIVVGAHYDHLGMGGRDSLSGEDTRLVHNGADDNASGTAAVLELAERLAVRTSPLQRSVLFIFFTGEESGLLGSEHFVDNPLVPLDKVVAMLNLDMVGRVQNETIIVGGRETAPAFDALIAEIDEESPLKTSRMSNRTFGASDHASFMRKKIPVLFLFSGLHADYHRPTDDVEKINYDGMLESVNLAEEAIRSLAVLPRQPYVAPPPPASRPSTRRTGEERPQLGLVPSYVENNDGGPDGIRVEGTTPNTAAQIAGVKGGDIVQAINAKQMRTLEDLMEYLQSAKVGDKVTLHIIREGKPIQLEATLKARAD